MRKFLIKRSLNANAFQASVVRYKFADKLPHVHEHIIKLILMPDVLPVEHWKGEIATALNTISKIKGRGYPKANMLFQWSYGDYEDELNNPGKLRGMLRQVQEEYSDLSMLKIDLNTLQQKVKVIMHDYLEWLCQLLPVDGYVEPSLCKKKLTEILEKER
jgi:hypothetical protein